MPTPPRRIADTPRLTAPIHKSREIAESFGTDAEGYDRARPRYPDALIQRIAAESPGPDILVAGSGTGIDARQFQAAGCQVLAVEPDARMAAFAEKTGVPTEVANFEDWDPAGRTFDTVAAGMAWHWIDPVAGAAKAYEVLRPGGRLTTFWYVMQSSAELREATKAVYERVKPDLPYAAGTAVSVESYSAFLTRAETGIAEAGGFGEPERMRYDWSRTYTRDAWLELALSGGGMNRLPADQLAALRTGLGEAVDTIGGTVAMEFAAIGTTVTRDA